MDLVLHLAAVTGKAAPETFHRTNVIGTRALLAAARAADVRRFIFVSTIAVTFPDTRRYPYAQSKIEAERLVMAGPLPWTILRPTMVAGPGSPVFRGLARLATLPLIPAFGGAHARVQPIMVDDLAERIGDMVESSQCDRQTLELGGPEILSLRSLLGRLRRHLDPRRPARFVNVPLFPILNVLGLLEQVFLGAVPLTAGQLATFRFDGLAKALPAVLDRGRPLAGIDEMIRASFTA
jgi:NADH dehydrogenase